MTDPRFRALIDLVGDAIELPPEQRDPFLVGRCGADVALLSEARQLLALSSRGDITETARHAVMQAAGGLHPAGHPSQIGPYQVVQVLGEGGMGVVYGTRQESPIRRDVAVKVMRTGLITARAMARACAARRGPPAASATFTTSSPPVASTARQLPMNPGSSTNAGASRRV